MNGSTSPVNDGRTDEEERLNEQFHVLLRDAADKREGRTKIHTSEDDAAAKQESADLLALARGDTPAQADSNR